MQLDVPLTHIKELVEFCKSTKKQELPLPGMLKQNSEKGVWNEEEVLCNKEFSLESSDTEYFQVVMNEAPTALTALWLQGWIVKFYRTMYKTWILHEPKDNIMKYIIFCGGIPCCCQNI